MSRMVWKYTAVAVFAVLTTVLFLSQSEEVKAGWISRDNSAITPVAVYHDGVYMGVGFDHFEDPPPGTEVSSAFTYQGSLTDGGSPANGVYDFRFWLYDAESGGNQTGSAVTVQDVMVTDGLFTVSLDFGSQLFTGEARWLEIGVRAGDSTGNFTRLSPRQALTAAPYALTLQPGAVISGTVEDGAVLHLQNLIGDGLQGVGVQGTTNSTNPFVGYGVAGFQSGYGTSDNEFWASGGMFGGRNGVIGITKENGGYAIFGINRGSSTGGFAGRFRAENGDGVWISAPTGEIGLSVTGGSKNAAVATSDGARLLYSEESTEVWFTDYGFGQLDGGVAVITIDPIYAQTVNLDEPYHVFLQAYGDADLYVTNRTSTQFEVHLREGDALVEFSYRLVGKRLGFEEDRLERAPWADSDRHLYSDGPPKRAVPMQEQGQ